MRRFSVWVAFLSVLAVGQRAHSQELSQDRAPRFLVASSARTLVPVDVKRTPVLARRIALDLDGVTLKEALVAITAQAGLDLFYSDDAVPLERRVHLRAQAITVAAALTDVLLGVDVDVVFSPNGRAALVRRGSGLQTGTVTGRVTDSASGQAVAGVGVFLNRTRWRATTDADGRYRMADVVPGPYTLAARRIGYRLFTQPVTVEADQEAIVDVTLQPAPSDLEAVVVTATGEQRLLELGHVVGRIDADSIVRAAPVTTLSELLAARVPGLQVLQTQGTVGGSVTLQIRGPNSLSSTNAPIVVIDGVRYTTTQRGPLFCCLGAGAVENSSPLNDLNPNDIESIDVVKGPSAATLYGTDAANGVLVITTKRGRPGPPRWNAYTKFTVTEVATDDLPDIYWGWGTVSGIPDNPNLSCTLARLASGACTRQDSVTVIPNPLKDSEYSLLAAKPAYEYGTNVSGGTPELRYSFSADYTDATGPLQMPPAIAEQVKQRLGLTALPREWAEPNSLTNLNVRSNVSLLVGENIDLHLSTGYIRSATNGLTFDGEPYRRAMLATPGNPTHPYGTLFEPGQVWARRSTDNVDRLVGSVRAEWRQGGWFTARAVVGLDALSSRKYALVRPGDIPVLPWVSSGQVEDTRTRQRTATADLTVSALARRGRLTARTSAGAQYVRSLFDASGSYGEGLSVGQSTVQGALVVQSSASYSESVLLGGYLEETLGLNERLFLTGALRADGASTFGRDYQAALYPKAGASWLLTAEPFFPRVNGLDELRLRYAFGASGKQPDPSWARPGFFLQKMSLGGTQVNTVRVINLGNPDLRPERMREHEFGLDARGLDGRIGFEATWFSRRTKDQLVSLPSPPGFGQIYHNVGLTTQSGFEAKVDARLIDSRALTLNVRLQHASHSTLLVDLGGGAESGNLALGGWKEGYPLGARFSPIITGWNDANGDGILTFSEVTVSDTAVYLGVSTPPQTQTFSAVVGLVEQRVRVSALFERKSGFVQYDGLYCIFGRACREAVDKTTPLEEQVRVFSAANFGFTTPEPADFIRLREVSVAFDLPARWLGLARLSQGTLVLSGRNLALWSKFSGPDPEVRGLTINNLATSSVGGGEASGVPLGRIFSVRLDLGF